MTIRRGEEWGRTVPRPADLEIVAGDRALAARLSAGPGAALGVGSGDLHRSLGSPIARPVMQRVEVDLLRVTVGDVDHVAVAHVLARRSWWRGPMVAVMNVDHLGDWNVAPRAHPNDGRFDVVEVDAAMRLRDRWQARRRLPQGTHVPHPHIALRTSTAEHWNFDRPLDIWIDGEGVGSSRSLAVRLEPDAFELYL